MVNDYFKGKQAIITGGSAGMGLSIAKDLVKAGASVAIVARNEERLQNAKKQIESVGLQENQFVDAMKADVTDEAQVSDVIDAYIEAHGTPFFLFNCAGAAEPGYIQDFSIDQFRTAMNLDYFGYVIPTMKMLPYFIQAKQGHVILISSIGGYIGIIGYGTYTPAKFAIVGFAEVLRHEMKPKGIKISVVAPPDVDTPGYKKENEIKPQECVMLSARDKIMQPDDVAKVVLKGVSKNAFTILPGDSKFNYNMKRLFPSLVFNVLDGDLKKALKKLGK